MSEVVWIKINHSMIPKLVNEPGQDLYDKPVNLKPVTTHIGNDEGLTVVEGVELVRDHSRISEVYVPRNMAAKQRFAMLVRDQEVIAQVYWTGNCWCSGNEYHDHFHDAWATFSQLISSCSEEFEMKMAMLVYLARDEARPAQEPPRKVPDKTPKPRLYGAWS
jgi:hypothetical protein